VEKARFEGKGMESKDNENNGKSRKHKIEEFLKAKSDSLVKNSSLFNFTEENKMNVERI
jgi:hypothetical protein